MHKKLLLIQPSPYGPKGQPVKKQRLYFPGLTLPALATLTPADWEVEACLETIEDIPFHTDASVIGIGAMGHAAVRTLDIAREFKRRGKTVIIGGYMASLLPHEAKKHCDAVVIGDAEGIWAEILADAARSTLAPFYEKPLTSLSTPLPRYEIILNKPIGDFLPVQAGRGCPNSCSFCSVSCLYKGRYLKRPLGEVLRDITRVKELGFQKFLLLDDNIAADPDYLKELCAAISSYKMQWFSQCAITVAKNPALLKIMAQSGCVMLSFGLESITQASLTSMHKAWANVAEYPALIRNIQDAGIAVSTEMVVGADGDTLASIRATAQFIEANGIVAPRFYILTPIPGTRFFEDMQEQARIVDHDYLAYNGTKAVHRPQNMTVEQLTAAYWELYREVYSLRSILKRTILQRDFWQKPLNYLFYLYGNLYYRHQIKQGITPNIM